MARQELARLLRDYRKRLEPAEVGRGRGRRRRTPGLRREEVAEQAAVSVDYVVRLEQGRGPNPSARVLESLAGVLRLDAAERVHLFRTAGVSPEPPLRPPHRVGQQVEYMLHRMPDVAAVVTDARYDVVAFSPLADVLLGDLRREPNLARRHFLNCEPREISGGEEFELIAVSRLRGSLARYPLDESLAALVSELRTESRNFERVWRTAPVRVPSHRRKTITHPRVGPLRLNCDVVPLPEDDQQMVFVTADRGSSEEQALHRLRR
ncbi:helix-turn-helix transcriptional regulator [Actinopolyspora sp. H202]|uniref:helix-turn-helix transcriptional regulator n=1 Tax=Actinopolyspora sp. H202 TaxID=1500456 RepID=UPI003EE655D9